MNHSEDITQEFKLQGEVLECQACGRQSPIRTNADKTLRDECPLCGAQNHMVLVRVFSGTEQEGDERHERIYLAARHSRAPQLRELRDELQRRGFAVTSRWIDGGHELTKEGSTQAAHEERRRFAEEDWADMLAADVVVSFTEEPRKTNTRGGRHVEFGGALATGKRCVVIGWRENVFHCLGNVEFFDSQWDWLRSLDSSVAVHAPADSGKLSADGDPEGYGSPNEHAPAEPSLREFERDMDALVVDGLEAEAPITREGIYSDAPAGRPPRWVTSLTKTCPKCEQDYDSLAYSDLCPHSVASRSALLLIEPESEDAAANPVSPAPKGDSQPVTDGLYGVGGQVYTFIHQIRNDLLMSEQGGMARRAQELLDAIHQHDKEVEAVSRRLTAECKAELDAEAAAPAPLTVEQALDELSETLEASRVEILSAGVDFKIVGMQGVQRAFDSGWHSTFELAMQQVRKAKEKQ
jgi:hypothetical protein